MQLADRISISVLIDDSARPHKSNRRRDTPVVLTPVGKRRHCKCGTCDTCLDNARWDRVFREKFEDPDYYKPRSVHHGSSLNWST